MPKISTEQIKLSGERSKQNKKEARRNPEKIGSK